MLQARENGEGETYERARHVSPRPPRGRRRRCAAESEGRVPRGPRSQLRAVAAAIEDDLGSLEQLMRELGIEPSRTKDALARVAEQVARVKSSSPFAGSGSTELMDLEMLVVGITGKRALWISLREADVTSDPHRLDALINRATAQLEAVEGQRRHAARACLS